MTSKTIGIQRFLPLRPLDFQVLTVLGRGELHGYGIVQAAKVQFPDQPALELAIGIIGVWRPRPMAVHSD